MEQLTQAQMGQLNARDLAKYKHDWKAFKASQKAAQPDAPEVEEVVVEEPVIPQEPKEKKQQSKDAEIHVCVSLPNKEIKFTLRRRDVLANVSQARMNETEFRMAIVNALAPLMGRVE